MTIPVILSAIGGGAATPVGHWRSGSETDTPTMSFGVGLFEHRSLRRYFLLQLLILPDIFSWTEFYSMLLNRYRSLTSSLSRS